jgi:hypothetical protein
LVSGFEPGRDDLRTLDLLAEPAPAFTAQGGGLVFRGGRLAGEESRRVSDQHFSIDATLIEAWASLKRFKPKQDDRGDGNGWAGFKGERRRNDTHESTTDPEAKLVRKGDGREAKLAFARHAAMENRHGVEWTHGLRPAYTDRVNALDAEARRMAPNLSRAYATWRIFAQLANHAIAMRIVHKLLSAIGRSI